MSGTDINSLGSFAWPTAKLPQDDFMQSEHGKVALPFVTLRRLDCFLAQTNEAVLSLADTFPDDMDEIARSQILYAASCDGIPLPSQHEKAQISAAIEASSQQSPETSRRVIESIDRLREHRAAPVTAAVTHHIDVNRYGNQSATDRTLDRIEEVG
ncbi:hypothetical protein [Primorskyibacter sp. S87]|uniref:hypothetical protein n=1 Tax=Primorskyibacter sp. S87 TaxID=3415126 RepID=UPI003C7AF1B6